MVEGAQYKDLLVYYKKIKDNLQEMDKVKNNIGELRSTRAWGNVHPSSCFAVCNNSRP